MRPISLWAGLLCLLAMPLAPRTALAQLDRLSRIGSAPPTARDEPVTFMADQVQYDREKSLVIARGKVEAWQGGRVVQADQMTFDRSTGVVVAAGNVVMLEPGGQVLFAEYAELNRDMSEGILKSIRGILDRNGRLAANGMRRTGGLLNELSRVVYSACDQCKDDPSRPLVWQIEAASAIQDTEHKTIEYRDAVLRMGGVPVAYAPFFWHPDPSEPRQSGLLPPVFGVSSVIGGFYGQPYYWAIDGQSDATIMPMGTTRAGGLVDTQYRRRFDSGMLTVNLAGAYQPDGPQGSLAAHGQFAIDDTWRWGFDINRASSLNFVRGEHIVLGLAGDQTFLPSTIYTEGFGEGSYARIDAKSYQGLIATPFSSRLPSVLPRALYSYTGTPDRFGGRLSVDTGMFNVLRTDGTSTRRADLTMNWERPFQGPVGDLWKITLHGESAGYDASSFQRQPNYGPGHEANTGFGQPGAAVDLRWPLARDAGLWGSQLIEPMLQLVVAPRTGDSQISRIPNEDSLAFEFSDANLFGFNRFSGMDRQEGGSRLNAALHGAWYLGGTVLDGIVGQSYRDSKNTLFPAASGLRDQVSDIVARASLSPAKWLDLTYRTRLDKTSMQIRMADATASVGSDRLRLTGGYLYSTFDPYFFYTTPPPPVPGSTYFLPRDEVIANLSSRWERYRFTAYARRNLAANQMVNYGVSGAYEDECFTFDMRFTRRLTSFLNDHGSTAVLFFFTFKTVGQFGYRAI